MTLTDAQFFAQHPDRQARIRLPEGLITTDKRTHHTSVTHECELDFRRLGPHDRNRRRILVWRVPHNHPTHPDHMMRIPFLLFADESVEDDDATLLPILSEIMRNAAKEQNESLI